MFKVCLTGGPGAGKTSAQSILTQKLENHGYKVLFCPETASELIINGIVPGEEISMDRFQEFVLDKQIAKENIYDEIASCYDSDNLVIIYDRGIADQMAYINREDFYRLLEKRNMKIADVYARYDVVIHLVSAAVGAEKYYVWNNPNSENHGNNAARSESPQEAALKDKKTMEAWVGHPHLRVIDNSASFDVKMQSVLEEVFSCLAIPSPLEIERKFLIKKPTPQQMSTIGRYSKSDIIQTYLLANNNSKERRVRQRGDYIHGFSYHYTEKADVGPGTRTEKERRISKNEYLQYLTESDPTLHPISKTRYCFIYKNRYFEMDTYPFSDTYAILEIEVNDINDEIELPPFLTIVDEVTNENGYKNHYLARSLSLDPKKNMSLIGKTIKILYMQGEPAYDGKIGVVEHIDGIGQLHGTWGGLAVIPESDKYEVIE